MKYIKLRFSITLVLWSLSAKLLAVPAKFNINAQPAPAALMSFSKQAALEVIFSPSNLAKVKTNEVIGRFEPDDALLLLLRGTGFNFQSNAGGKFVITSDPASQVATGSIRGTLSWSDGRPAPDVLLVAKETGQTAKTDKYGEYYFPSLKTGTYLLIATAEGYQPLHITDVLVISQKEIALKTQIMRKALDVTKLAPYLVQADVTSLLDPYEVTSNRVQPFQSANVDLPRTIDDAQPYLIFERRAIEQSGATSVEN
jgi:hypothetical protein